MGTRAYFTGVTILISLPTGTKIFNWLSTYLGNPPLLQLKTSSAFFGLLFLLMFTIGGSTGIILGNAAVDLGLHAQVLLIIFFLFFLLFLVSEGLLFVSFFWTSFHSLSSSILGIWPGEGFYLPDPCELTFANTLLLSNAAISLGNAFISLEISSQFLIFFSLFSFILAWTFISLQIKEFRIMGLSINDSVYSCLFFFL